MCSNGNSKHAKRRENNNIFGFYCRRYIKTNEFIAKFTGEKEMIVVKDIVVCEDFISFFRFEKNSSPRRDY